MPRDRQAGDACGGRRDQRADQPGQGQVQEGEDRATGTERRAAMNAKGKGKAWRPVKRERVVSAALRAYAAMATSADTGAVRDVSQVEH